jgi:hypothetical protein
VAFLPLPVAWLWSEPGHMSSAISNQVAVIRRLANRVGRVVAECNEATTRLTTLACTPARYPVDPDRAPDTYEQFLIRTAGVAQHELERRACHRPG